MPQDWAFVFRHKEVGELGRLRVQQVRGQTRISSEVVGDPADPMTKKRQATLEPLTSKISDEMVRFTGEPEKTTPPPPSPKDQGEVVASRLLQCNHCRPEAKNIYPESGRRPGSCTSGFQPRSELLSRLEAARTGRFPRSPNK